MGQEAKLSPVRNRAPLSPRVNSRKNSKVRILEWLWICAIALVSLCDVLAEEPEDTQILSRIFKARDEILGSAASIDTNIAPRFVALWDFDGTILKGDCSEGLKQDGRGAYAGLAQVAIERGLSSVY